MARLRLRKRDIEAVRAADKKSFDEWRKTRTYRSLVGTFYLLLAAFAGTVVFYLVPVDYPDDDVIACTVTETKTFEDGKKPPATYTETVECEPRALPSWVLVAGPSLVAAPLIALTLLRPGRVEIELNVPGTEGAATFRSGSSVADLMQSLANETSEAAENYD